MLGRETPKATAPENASRRAYEESGGLRVFQIDVETCPHCGATVKIIACIEDPPERILRHLASKDLPGPGLWPESRAPPVRVQRTGRPVERTGLSH
jgi:hypothetical protein